MLSAADAVVAGCQVRRRRSSNPCRLRSTRRSTVTWRAAPWTAVGERGLAGLRAGERPLLGLGERSRPEELFPQAIKAVHKSALPTGEVRPCWDARERS